MRIDNLSFSNTQTQGAQRRAWLRLHAPQHLEQCSTLMLRAMRLRDEGAARCTVILGAGACTEIPLATLVRASEEVVLVDLDQAAMQRGRAELAAPALQHRVRLIQADISGGVSQHLARQIARHDWQHLVSQGAETVFDAAAACLDACTAPDPPVLPDIAEHDNGLVISSLVLSQLFSYPLLDLLDHLQHVGPHLSGEQERHRRYQEAAQAFRMRVIAAHLHLLHSLADHGGIIVLLSDVRGFAFNVHGTDHDATHRRWLPLVPRAFFDLLNATFTIVEEHQWEWISDLPEQQRPGRGYEVKGYILKSKD